MNNCLLLNIFYSILRLKISEYYYLLERFLNKKKVYKFEKTCNKINQNDLLFF